FPILDGGFLDDTWERDGPDPSGHEPAAGQSLLSRASGEAMNRKSETRNPNSFATKPLADRLRREAFGVRRIPALCQSSARRKAKAPEYGALQTLRAVWLRLCRPEDRRALPPAVTDPLSWITEQS